MDENNQELFNECLKKLKWYKIQEKERNHLLKKQRMKLGYEFMSAEREGKLTQEEYSQLLDGLTISSTEINYVKEALKMAVLDKAFISSNSENPGLNETETLTHQNSMDNHRENKDLLRSNNENSSRKGQFVVDDDLHDNNNRICDEFSCDRLKHNTKITVPKRNKENIYLSDRGRRHSEHSSAYDELKPHRKHWNEFPNACRRKWNNSRNHTFHGNQCHQFSCSRHTSNRMRNDYRNKMNFDGSKKSCIHSKCRHCSCAHSARPNCY